MHSFTIVSCVVNQDVEGALGEEELVGGMIDLLAAKVPHVELKGLSLAIGKLMAVDVDSLGGFLFRR